MENLAEFDKKFAELGKSLPELGKKNSGELDKDMNELGKIYVNGLNDNKVLFEISLLSLKVTQSTHSNLSKRAPVLFPSWMILTQEQQ